MTTTTTYDGLSSAPIAIGKYVVHSEILDPNYEGSATGEFRLGQSLQSWLTPLVENGSIPPDAIGANDDPDHDSIPNLLEYAFGLNPAAASPSSENSGVPKSEYSEGHLSLIFQKNLTAADLDFQVESTDLLAGDGSWNPAATTESVLATNGTVQTVRVTLPNNPSDPKRFVRLKVVRATP